ncbi:Rhodanese domain protein [Gloeothece citriformis PCC 7424]|uniref:Rhodanese domain protein n=1 Tax=Gloeothece citriformis (strain PCC 7424) TaxID=65393 RepID=B7KB30_GLOC7|nr:rhodanese-like domain-containing protein [Gloeothece citriformis]ACK70140.1 Rhodanese domain protein [Gloeothece citriformis PCC 7424]
MTTTRSRNLTDKLQVVDASTLKQWLEAQQVILVDVREPSEYAEERISNAIPIPLSTFDPKKIPFEENKKLVLYCRGGNRSTQAAQKLLAAGFENITHLQNGITGWKQAGYPTQINGNAPISIMRQVQIVAGSLVLIGTILGAFISPWFLILSGFVGSGLLFAGITNTCALGMLLAKLPYNQSVKG